MNVNLMQGKIVDFDGVDAVLYVPLHPLSHLAIAYVGKILHASTELLGF